MSEVKVVIRKNYPARRTVTGFFAFAVLLLVSTIILFPILILTPQEHLFGYALVVTVVAELITIAAILKYNGQWDTWKETLGLKKASWKWFLLAALLGAALFGGLQGIAYLLMEAGYTIESSDTSVSMGSLEGFARILLLGLFAPLIVPFVEELFFRGMVIGSFLESSIKDEWKVKVAVIVSALSFGIAHFQGMSNVNDLVLMGWIILMGFILAFLRLKSGSVFVPFVTHAVYNGITVAIAFLIL